MYMVIYIFEGDKKKDFFFFFSLASIPKPLPGPHTVRLSFHLFPTGPGIIHISSNGPTSNNSRGWPTHFLIFLILRYISPYFFYSLHPSRGSSFKLCCMGHRRNAVWGRQLPKWLYDCHLLVFKTLYKALPWVWARLSDVPLIKRIQQKWWDVSSEMRI